MSMECKNKCDVCGKVEEARMDSFTWGRPQGWKTISGLGPVYSSDTPLLYQSKQPDLCSWACVAIYAAERADKEGEDARSQAACALRRAAQKIVPIGKD